jgi:hypothetical protein
LPEDEDIYTPKSEAQSVKSNQVKDALKSFFASKKGFKKP